MKQSGLGRFEDGSFGRVDPNAQNRGPVGRFAHMYDNSIQRADIQATHGCELGATESSLAETGLASGPCPFEGVEELIEQLAKRNGALIGERSEARNRFGRGLDVELHVAAGPAAALL